MGVSPGKRGERQEGELMVDDAPLLVRGRRCERRTA